MRRSTNQNGNSPSKNAAHLMSTMSSASENNARVRNNTQSIKDKVESARRHLKSHQRQFHTGEDSSSGESVENKSPHHHPHRSHSSPRDSGSAAKSRNKERHTPSVLYSAELQHSRRVSGETRMKSMIVKERGTTRTSPSKSISPMRKNESFLDQSAHDQTLTSSPRRRSTYLVEPRRDSYRGDATFTATRRETFTIDRRYETTVSHDETIIAPGLLEEEYHPRKQRTQSHGSISAFHARCIPKDAHPYEVPNTEKWDVEFLPGSLINASKIEKDRRSAAVDILTPSAESIRYQMERTKREEEEVRRIVDEQTNGRSTREIFDSWIPLDEERRKRKGGEQEGETTAKKSTRRLWEAEDNEERGGEGGVLSGVNRKRRDGEERRVVMEDEAGYAMPLPRNMIDRPSHRTPSPLSHRQPSPDEQFFTPLAPTPRLSRISGISERKEVGETPILGRQSTRLSSTFLLDRSDVMDRSVRRLRGGMDEANRSVGSSFERTPDRRDESIGGGERSLGEYATPIGRRDGRRMEGEENSFLNVSSSSHNRSRALNESANAFERSLNRSLDNLSSLASRLSSQLEASRANLSALAAPSSTPLRDRVRDREEGVAGDDRFCMDASILGSLPPMREERQSAGGEELRKMMSHSSERGHRSSLPDQSREEEPKQEERIQRMTSPIPRPRTTIPSSFRPHPSSPSIPISSVHGLASLLDANIGRMERSEEYERDAHRLEGVVREMNETAVKVENAVKEKSLPLPLPSSAAPPTPLPRSYRPSPLSAPSIPIPLPRSNQRITAQSAHPVHQLAIETAGGRDELMEMYEARHRNWHRRGDEIAIGSPRSSDSRSPSPNLPPSSWNPAEWRERQSVQGMLDQRAKAVRGAFLHLLQRLYKARHGRRYDEKERFRGDALREEEFAKEQEREVESFKKEANEAKMKAIDPSIKYRDFMQWLKEESERIEAEIVWEVETRERRRYERNITAGIIDDSLLSSSRLAEANKLLDERAKKALRARDAANRHVEKRDEVRRLEMEARRAVAFAEIPSSARSSIDGSSFLLNQSMRRYSIGNEPVRVTSARGAETSFNLSRDGRSLDESRFNNADTSIGRDRRRMSEMKDKLEEKRRQAEEVRRAMEDSQRRMNETEMVSVAAQLAAHDEYIEGVENVGRIIAQNVQPRSPIGLPPGIEPLDLSSLDEEKVDEEERKSDMNSLEKSTDISGKKDNLLSSALSGDSLNSIPPPSIPSIAPSTKHSTSSSHSRSSTSSTSSSTSSNKTLKATEELSQKLEEMAVDEKNKESTVIEEKEKEKEDVVFSPLSEGRNDELDRSLPSTAASTGRQELTLDTVPPIDTVPISETTVSPVELPSAPLETPTVPTETVHTVEDVFDGESIPEEILEDTVERSTVPSRALFSPIESSTTQSEESESSSDRRGVTVVGGGRNTVEKKKESIEERTDSSVDTEEEKALDVSTASLKKAISVASEMANPFDGFESSSGGSRKSEEKMEEKEIVAPSTVTTTTTTSQDVTTVIDTSLMVQREEEEDEISWGDGSEGGLEVGGGSARSDDFDWGVSRDEKEKEEKKEEEEEVKQVEPQTQSVQDKDKEKESKPTGRFSSLRDRLNKINAEDDEERNKKISSSSSSSTATSSSRSSSSKTTSTEKSTSENTEETSGESSGRKEEKEEEDEKTPRAVSSVSGGLSSASGSIDFDAEIASSRTPRIPQRNRFRLSLNDSFQESQSPRGSTTLKSSPIYNGRIMGTGSPRITTPTSPHTPRATVHSAMMSPSGAASPEGRRSRFSAVMPISPRSGRRSTSPKNFSLSREVSFAQDDSSFGDISRLSAVELPHTSTAGISNLPPILSSLPPINSPSLLPPSRPSIGLNRSSIEEGDELDESVYESLMDVQIPVKSALSSLPIGHLIEKDQNEEVSPPLTLTARSDNSQGQHLALFKKEAIQPLLVKEIDQLWKIIEKKGFFAKEDTNKLAKMDVEMDEDEEVARIRKDRNLLLRAVSSEVATSLYSRDERRTKDGRTIPKEIMPLRRLRPRMEKRRLQEVMEKELITKGEAPVFATRMKNLGVEFASLPVEERILYSELYENEDNIFQSDAERGEIMEDLMKL